jgi:nucleoside-diphosphate-sugar epimerase
MDILLTGATGFLGSALARHWVGQGHVVTVLVRPGSSRARLADIGAQLTWLQAEGAQLVAAVRQHPADVIVHTACSYGRRQETPLQIFEANVQLGMLLLQGVLAREPARRCSLLHTGSVLDAGLSLYALSKQQFADWGARLAAQHPQQLQFIQLRLQHLYGPGDDASKFSSHVLRACARGEPTLALTACMQRRDFIHVQDAVSAIATVLQERVQFAACDAVDVGSGQAPPLRHFVETARRLIGARTRLDFGALPLRAGEPERCQADTTRLRAMGWAPRYTLEQGLRDTLAADGHQQPDERPDPKEMAWS